jgi:hypothetical protein
VAGQVAGEPTRLGWWVGWAVGAVEDQGLVDVGGGQDPGVHAEQLGRGAAASSSAGRPDAPRDRFHSHTVCGGSSDDRDTAPFRALGAAGVRQLLGAHQVAPHPPPTHQSGGAQGHVRIVTSAAGLGSYKVEQALQVRSFAIGCLDWTVEMTIGVGIFLMVLGAILAFAVQTDVPGINVNSLGIILLLIGLVAVLYSLVFWSNLTPWGRRRIIARRRLVGGTRTEEVVEERPLDDGLL